MHKDNHHAPSSKQHAEIQKLQQEIGELTEALQRERADVINIRRRHDEQIGSLKNMVKAQIISELLPAIDNLERALAHAPKQNQESRVKSQEEKKLHEWANGVQKVYEQFEKTLQDLGVAKIKSVGEPFDPNLHEAVSMEHGSGNHEIVSEELHPGYTLGDEVLRPAMVKVKGT